MAKSKTKPKEAGAPPLTIHSPALDKLTLKQQMFVQAIAVPGSDTFGNGAQSAVVAGYAVNGDKGRRIATALRSKIDVSTAIDETFKKHNLGIEVRADAMSEILSDRYTEVEQLDIDGTVTQRTRMSNGKLRLATIRELNKMDGTYARAEAVGKAQGKLLEPILDEWTKRLRAELRLDTESSQTEPIMDGSQTTIKAEIIDVQSASTAGTQEQGADADKATPQGEGHAEAGALGGMPPVLRVDE